MTIYDLTEDERNVMRKLIENGMVVTIGEHAKVRSALNDSVEFMRGCGDSMRKHGYDVSASAIDRFIADRVAFAL